MQQEVEKLARQIILDHVLDIDYFSVCEIVADDYPDADSLSEAEFDEVCDLVHAKITNAKVIVKFGR